MTAQRRTTNTHRWDAGATLVEYSLVLALVVFAGLGSYSFLNDRAEDEVVNQADCVSMRPPPESCQLRAVTTTTTVVPPPTTTTTAAVPSSSTSSTTTTIVTSTASVSGSGTQVGSELHDAWVDVTVTSQGNPVEGAIVRSRWRVTEPVTTQLFFPECTTDATGTCRITVGGPFPVPATTQVQFGFHAIVADPPIASLPAGVQVEAT